MSRVIDTLAYASVAFDIEKHCNLPGFYEAHLKKLSSRDRKIIDQYSNAVKKIRLDMAQMLEQEQRNP